MQFLVATDILLHLSQKTRTRYGSVDGNDGVFVVYAALEYRIRKTLKDYEEKFPDPQGKPMSHPTAHWVFHYFVGIHVFSILGQGLFVLNLTDEYLHLLQLLGKLY